jgi:phosphoglycolate phosphatase
MAAAAGVDALAVTYGAHPGEQLRALAPRACVADVAQLKAWLETNG